MASTLGAWGNRTSGHTYPDYQHSHLLSANAVPDNANKWNYTSAQYGGLPFAQNMFAPNTWNASTDNMSKAGQQTVTPLAYDLPKAGDLAYIGRRSGYVPNGQDASGYQPYPTFSQTSSAAHFDAKFKAQNNSRHGQVIRAYNDIPGTQRGSNHLSSDFQQDSEDYDQQQLGYRDGKDVTGMLQVFDPHHSVTRPSALLPQYKPDFEGMTGMTDASFPTYQDLSRYNGILNSEKDLITAATSHVRGFFTSRDINKYKSRDIRPVPLPLMSDRMNQVPIPYTDVQYIDQTVGHDGYRKVFGNDAGAQFMFDPSGARNTTQFAYGSNASGGTY